MTINLTYIILAIISLIGAIITRYVIPWIKDKLDDNQYEIFKTLVRTGVYAAEQLYSSEQWKEKKKYVLDLLVENGYEIDSTAVDALIEATVRELRIIQNGPKKVSEEAEDGAE